MLSPGAARLFLLSSSVARLILLMLDATRSSCCFLYKRFDSFMIGHGYSRSKHDSCVYFRKLDNGFFIYLLLYVNDMLIASIEINKLKTLLKSEDLDRKKSLSGYVFSIGGCAVSWKSSLQPIVALSTTERNILL
uniref:Reverse transcriptase Ty1/copia-type domain-containing protein n=1 Tax=Ananas comosus var. bracteatus TaxID=296719 RepID=A0A6V7NSG1_ANACO|nr:unnamed protein product [Ananas comosus var. bracteatus]